MEALSTYLRIVTAQAGFKSHWRTQCLRLTHLCFADDLIAFCHGDETSVKLLLTGLSDFFDASGMQINRSKSVCFLANVSRASQTRLLNIINIPLGTLPMRFLGVPLITTRLSLNDCRPLLDRLTTRITSWTTKFLSYAGRLQLIKSVLFAIQSYWSAHFILPSQAIREIQRILSRFLWQGSLAPGARAKIAWQVLSRPLSEGGLGLKNLTEWNRALMMVHLWEIIQPQPASLWAQWVRLSLLRHKHFWIMPVPADSSWTWRKILQLRSIALPFLHYCIGDGSSVSLWFDPWFNNKPLASSVHDPIIVQSGLDCSATVRDLLRDGQWFLPISNHHSLHDFKSSFDYSRQYNLHAADRLFWDTHSLQPLKAAVFWESLRTRSASVGWYRAVWPKVYTPSFSFITWLACYHRLFTADRLQAFGYDVDPNCRLCGHQLETFQHLFFQCSYAFSILFPVLRCYGWKGFSRNFFHLADSFSRLPSRRPRVQIWRYALTAVTYYVWKERNSRWHHHDPIPARIHVRHVQTLIQCRLSVIPRFHGFCNRRWPHPSHLD